jgi:TolB-like protein/Tfp pilus assembly protein PilF
LPRRGYRFIAPLVAVTPAVSTAAAPAARVRLAVLPFSNLSDDSSQEYFSDGLTEEMIAQLGRLCRGRVGIISRWSSMVFKGTTLGARAIGESLRVDYLLEGTVRRNPDRVRITARLIEVSSETHLWSETYERELTDCLSVQAEVAARIARSLAMELLPQEAPPRQQRPDAAAYQAYLKGRYFWNKPGDDGLDQAIVSFEQALGAAPGFAAVHAALARARIACAETYRELPRVALEAAQHAAMQALAIDPTLCEAHLALADARRMLTWDWTAAESAYSQALALNPSYESAHRAYGMMLSALGRHDDALRETERACELDPLCLVVNVSAAWARYAAGDYDGAIERCRATTDLDPGYLPARRLLAAAALQDGRLAEAMRELDAALDLAPDDPVLMAWSAHAAAATGHRAAAVKQVARLKQLERTRYVPGYHLALAHTGIGNVDGAFDALDQACIDRDPVLAHFAIEPRFEPLRSDDRYRSLLDRLGLPLQEPA